MIGELSPLTFHISTDMCLCIPAILNRLLYLILSYSFSGPLFFWSYSIWETWDLCLGSSVWSLSWSIPRIAGLVVMNSFSLFLSWTVFIFLLNLKLSFDGHNNLGWHISFQALLDFRVWAEKSEVSLMGLLLNVTWYFSLSDFNILSLFLLDILIMMCLGILFWLSQ